MLFELGHLRRDPLNYVGLIWPCCTGTGREWFTWDVFQLISLELLHYRFWVERYGNTMRAM